AYQYSLTIVLSLSFAFFDIFHRYAFSIATSFALLCSPSSEGKGYTRNGNLYEIELSYPLFSS
ncbi:MAG: hypothetical protein QM528_08455, partial [Phycisphaerales bacterium]|nr:hypothetical protein [Phycisphaerales bacterium]